MVSYPRFGLGVPIPNLPVPDSPSHDPKQKKDSGKVDSRFAEENKWKKDKSDYPSEQR